MPCGLSDACHHFASPPPSRRATTAAACKLIFPSVINRHSLTCGHSSQSAASTSRRQEKAGQKRSFTANLWRCAPRTVRASRRHQCHQRQQRRQRRQRMRQLQQRRRPWTRRLSRRLTKAKLKIPWAPPPMAFSGEALFNGMIRASDLATCSSPALACSQSLQRCVTTAADGPARRALRWHPQLGTCQPDVSRSPAPCRLPWRVASIGRRVLLPHSPTLVYIYYSKLAEYTGALHIVCAYFAKICSLRHAKERRILNVRLCISALFVCGRS
mmetsp:Transcript_17959/g.45934  ORF Transcript_17959/g.45934 Transcript_17959/m.45934 type:complete len:271 (+) Transcript_17959:83-895(+)